MSTGKTPDPYGGAAAATIIRRAESPSVAIGRGTRLLNGRFELEERLGGGGMGEVYQAVDLEAARLDDPNARIALKILGAALQSMPEAVLALQREASRARRLAHPNIVRVYEFYEDRGVRFITMELLSGYSWDRLIGEHELGVPLEEARPLIQQLCAALSYAHAEGVVHSDLKPQNLFLTADNKVKVLDFGIAAQVRAPLSNRRETVYNPRRLGALSVSYACLEMWLGLDADPRDDVYSLGCILYELLHGSHPFKGLSAAEACETKLSPKPLDTLTRAQNQALAGALQFTRSDRTASVEQFAAQFWGTQGVALGRDWRIWAGGGLVAASIATGLLLYALPRHPQTPPAPPSERASRPEVVPGSSVAALAALLGMTDNPFRADSSYSREEIRAVIARSPRRVKVGSSNDEIEAAVTLCKSFAKDCKREWYADEVAREAILKPLALDTTPVDIRAFRAFTSATGYVTAAEREGGAYVLVDGRLRWVKGGNWRNAVGLKTENDNMPVVAVDYADAQRFCDWAGRRLPTEDEWEYVARGPQRYAFPWGNDPAPAQVGDTLPPSALDGPAEGIGGAYRGLSGNVWEWVDTQIADRRILKGGSWLERNPANRRAAARRSESPNRADADSGFRCARAVSDWPDASAWITTLLTVPR